MAYVYHKVTAMPSWHFCFFQVGSKTDCFMCIGPMVPDGYGICYNPMDDHINFAVTAFNSCEETNATKLTRFLKEALLDMKALLDQTPNPSNWGCLLGDETQSGNLWGWEEEDEVFAIPACVLKQNVNMQELTVLAPVFLWSACHDVNVCPTTF